ncbi:MAG: pyridoxine 5'-phosphate synthase, partial [Candidatus Omnitrophota bacterium]|nr:pyridoxine 5'-phosphate synthase [Candidatus Omnitrophota bacterium]
MKLGVNIDHVATLRQARREFAPDPIEAARICEKAGADSIVCHLREDRRHINDQDLKRLKRIVKVRLNLEMSVNEEIVEIACAVKPDQATLVPEKRQEITTEGGLDLISQEKKTEQAIRALKKKGIMVSLFIDPSKRQVEMAHKIGADYIELHTGKYAGSKTKAEIKRTLDDLILATELATSLGLGVNAGH